MSAVRYLLDTNAVIAVLKDAAGPVSRHLHARAPAEVGVSAIVMHWWMRCALKLCHSTGKMPVTPEKCAPCLPPGAPPSVPTTS